MWVSFDIFMVAVWLIVTACSRQGFICCLLLVYYIFIHSLQTSNFHLFMLAAIAHFLTASSQLITLSIIRKVLFLQGCIFYIAAIDKVLYENFNVISDFKTVRPYLLTFLDFYMIAVFMGGRFDGLYRLLANRLYHGLLFVQTYATDYKARK
jgi:hypothetical protein